MKPTQVRGSDGNLIDARFAIESFDGKLSVIIESRGGTRGTSASRNSDYATGLELILERIGSLPCAIIDGFVESRATALLPLELRRLTPDGVEYPISIRDHVELARGLGAA
jgi:hypothetical protein